MNADILVVDDTPENLRLLLGILGKNGCHVRPASDGAYAIATAQANPPDVILLDIKMPGLNGYEVCARLKADERTRDVPILFISALHDTIDKVRGFAAGAVDYISKPFQAEEVLARVETHVTLARLQHELQARNRRLQQEIARREQAEEELRVLNQQLNATNDRLHETNAQLQERNHQLHEANACKDKFFSIIAHDLRSPFTGLIGLTEAMLEGFDGYRKDQLKHFIERIHHSAEQTYALLINLLAWSQHQRGVSDYAPEIFPIHPLVTHVARLFATGAAHKQIQITNLVPAETLAYADLRMIETVIRNLVSNALKFTPAGGTITVSSQQYAGTVEIAVADTGIGMTPENLAKLFRIDVKYTRQGTAGEESTGLGLILCQELVAKNGGVIRVASDVGQGTTFTFTLPCDRQDHT